MVESRFLYVGIRESKRMLHIAFFIKTFLIHSPTTYLQPVYVAKESMLCSKGKHAARFPLWRERRAIVDGGELIPVCAS